MSVIFDRIRREPALVTGLVSAVVALVTSFGLHLTDEQVGAITAVTIAIMAIVTRSQVTPAVDVVAQVAPAVVGTGVDVVAGPAHPAETGTPVEVPPAA